MRVLSLTMAWLLYSHLALAANPTISAVAITGNNTDLLVRIFGAGFGPAPHGVPCTRCSTPYLNIADGRGYGCQLLNILSWSDKQIAFRGFEGNPGDSVLISVENAATHLRGLIGVTVPGTVNLATPIIRSVSFAGGIGRNMEITVTGFRFGASPPGLPFIGDLPFFSLMTLPFATAGHWQAGYTYDSVFLKYGSWSPGRVVIVGFGGAYGTGGFVLHPDEPVSIAVANSGTCGLNMNATDDSLGPTSIGGVWAGHLP
jgi:hypothetical protein